ncbi:MAG: GNAT family N-acetyltransferase [Pseudomonadota bacterium]|nr:GNAT family N-acetyltransferase [Pseudomonadota bacterium]
MSWTKTPELVGQHVRLEPLAVSHGDALRAAVVDGELWRHWYTSVPRPEAVEAYVDAALAMQAAGDALAFAVSNAAGRVVGTTRFYQLAPATPRLQIGYTWYAASVQRTGVNTEAKLLLLAHAFEQLGCISVGFETSGYNFASRAAIVRLGARQDGVMRSHMRHADGSIRDTVAFSIIDSEWLAVKRHLQARLALHDGRDHCAGGHSGRGHADG